jgi:hypothetical protein
MSAPTAMSGGRFALEVRAQTLHALYIQQLGGLPLPQAGHHHVPMPGQSGSSV